MSTIESVSTIEGTCKRGIPGNLLVALIISAKLSKQSQQAPTLPGVSPGIYSKVLAGKASVQTNFELIVPKTNLQYNFIMVEITDPDKVEMAEAALLIQRLLVVETRRMMALFELSEVKRRKIFKAIDSHERELEGLVTDVFQHLQHSEIDVNLIRRHLQKATDISEKIEKLIVTNSSHLSVAQIHMATAIEFLDDLEEEENTGFMTLKQFLHHSIDPIVQANKTVSDRLENLSQHASNVIDVLRTQIESELLQKDSQINVVLFFLTVFAFCYYSAELVDTGIASIWEILKLPETLGDVSTDAVIRLASILFVVFIAVSFLFSDRFRYYSLGFQIRRQRDIHDVFRVAEQEIVEGVPDISPLIERLQSSDAATRHLAARDLRDLGGKLRKKYRSDYVETNIAHRLTRVLEGSDDKEVRSSTAFALGEIASLNSVSALEAALNDSAPEVRWEAAYALGKVGRAARSTSETILQHLKDLSFSDHYRRVRRASGWAHRKLEGRSR